MGLMENYSTAAYVDWEEVVVSSDKGRREVHYYLKRWGGCSKDLVVVGKEKSAGHIRYSYVIKDNKYLLSILNGSSRLKLRSRREVIDWLNSILSGERSKRSCKQFGGVMERNLDGDVIEDVLRQKSGLCKAEFSWLGSSWLCGKRRIHYPSFYRNGVVISAHEFVYVLAEEGKQLVAYIDDMYEDTRGNKMVVVRWFHKIDEVDFVLPHNYNDREIFFSHCLQDLNIECIDGLATVLSPEHHEKLSNEATRMRLVPFLCCKLFDDDGIKPFDITKIEGYWKQEIFRNRSSLHEFSGDDMKLKGCLSEVVGFRPNKRIRWSKESGLCLKSPNKGDSVETSLQFSGGTSLDCKGDMKKCGLNEGCSFVSLSGQENAKDPNSRQYLAIGSEVEVLCQDSGIRGCWFRALIIKKRGDKVKVQYTDLLDAVDESKNLEEWIIASRLAVPDALDVRFSGRIIVRPKPSSVMFGVSCVVDVGTAVDAWWHDGWWEGIVVKKESGDKLTVYFPEEKREQIFSPGDLRHSKEWIDNGWQNMKQRPDLVSAYYGTKIASGANQDASPLADDRNFDAKSLNNDPLPQKMIKIGELFIESDDKLPDESRVVVRDLSKDCLLAQLRWKPSGKRRRERSPVHKGQFGNISSSLETGLRTFEKLIAISSPMKLDPDSCKCAGDSRFGSSAVHPSTKLVMSR